MKTNRGTVEALIALYHQCHSRREERYGDEDADKPSVRVKEVLDYLTDPDLAKFCCIIDNLDRDVRLELLALLWLGREDDSTSDDFVGWVEHAKTTTDDGEGSYLFGKAQLVESWRRGMEIMELN